ncbi:MAG: acyl-[acyl-carrier-protein] thioesterase [Anaerolineales bacterium]
MTITHERTFRIRHYECDPYGHLNNAVYLRYMQETAFDASAAVGYDLETYSRLGHTWIARDTEVEYIRPFGYGELVTVRTWVADFRRVRSRRMYEFYSEDSDEPAARAYTDWVYVNSESGAPVRVPPEMARAFIRNGPSARLERDPFPEPPPQPPGTFRMRRRVAWSEIDSQGHVNNAEYLAYIEECGVQVVTAHNWSMTQTVSEGFAMVARRHRIEYRTPALMDDELEISTWISDPKRATCLRHYLITRVADGETLARCRTLWVWIDLETGRPIRIPPHFISAFKANMVE